MKIRHPGLRSCIMWEWVQRYIEVLPARSPTRALWSHARASASWVCAQIVGRRHQASPFELAGLKCLNDEIMGRFPGSLYLSKAPMVSKNGWVCCGAASTLPRGRRNDRLDWRNMLDPGIWSTLHPRVVCSPRTNGTIKTHGRFLRTGYYEIADRMLPCGMHTD